MASDVLSFAAFHFYDQKMKILFEFNRKYCYVYKLNFVTSIRKKKGLVNILYTYMIAMAIC